MFSHAIIKPGDTAGKVVKVCMYLCTSFCIVIVMCAPTMETEAVASGNTQRKESKVLPALRGE